MESDSRVRLLRLYQLLREESSEQHPISTPDVIRKLKEYWDIDAFRITVQRDVAAIQAAGVDVRIVRSTRNSFYIASSDEKLPGVPLRSHSVEDAREYRVGNSYIGKDDVSEDIRGSFLTPDALRFICAANGYDAEKIGQYFLELLPKMTKRQEHSYLGRIAVNFKENTERICDRIPSKLMRKELAKSGERLSVMQWASIAHMIFEGDDLANAFADLAASTSDEYEVRLLSAAIEDILEFGYTDHRALEVYRTRHPDGEFPLYPFLERCNLPILLKKGDLLRARAKKRFVYALVVDTPANLPEGSDFTDESYLCYDLGYSDPADLFAAHTHVHVCFAERIDEFALRDRCKENLKIIRQELEKREQEQENNGENT